MTAVPCSFLLGEATIKDNLDRLQAFGIILGALIGRNSQAEPFTLMLQSRHFNTMSLSQRTASVVHIPIGTGESAKQHFIA